MTFETEYQLQEFREIQQQYFADNGKLWGGLQCANLSSIMSQMLTLINQLESEIFQDDNNDKREKNTLAQVFIELEKSKNDFFNSIANIVKDYDENHKPPTNE